MSLNRFAALAACSVPGYRSITRRYDGRIEPRFPSFNKIVNVVHDVRVVIALLQVLGKNNPWLYLLYFTLFVKKIFHHKNVWGVNNPRAHVLQMYQDRSCISRLADIRLSNFQGMLSGYAPYDTVGSDRIQTGMVTSSPDWIHGTKDSAGYESALGTVMIRGHTYSGSLVHNSGRLDRLTVSTSRDAHYGVYVRGMKDSDWYLFLKVNINQKILWSLDTTSSRLQ